MSEQFEEEFTPPVPPRPWGARRRRVAVTLWCGFMSAVLSTIAGMVFGPQVFGLMDPAAGLGAITQWFLISWVVSLLPIAFAIKLADAPPSERP